MIKSQLNTEIVNLQISKLQENLEEKVEKAKDNIYLLQELQSKFNFMFQFSDDELKLFNRRLNSRECYEGIYSLYPIPPENYIYPVWLLPLERKKPTNFSIDFLRADLTEVCIPYDESLKERIKELLNSLFERLEKFNPSKSYKNGDFLKIRIKYAASDYFVDIVEKLNSRVLKREEYEYIIEGNNEIIISDIFEKGKRNYEHLQRNSTRGKKKIT